VALPGDAAAKGIHRIGPTNSADGEVCDGEEHDGGEHDGGGGGDASNALKACQTENPHSNDDDGNTYSDMHTDGNMHRDGNMHTDGNMHRDAPDLAVEIGEDWDRLALSHALSAFNLIGIHIEADDLKRLVAACGVRCSLPSLTTNIPKAASVCGV
jgi:hypothetical protein